MTLKKWGGAALVVAGGFFGREGLIWAYGKALDGLNVSVHSGIKFASLSWQNGVAIGLVVVGLALLLWPTSKRSASGYVKVSENTSYLYMRAVNMIDRIRHQRSAKWYERDSLEPLTDVARAGMSLLLLFRKAGFVVPHFQTSSAERVACGLEKYFELLVSLMSDGHTKEAKALSQEASEQAKSSANGYIVNFSANS